MTSLSRESIERRDAGVAAVGTIVSRCDYCADAIKRSNAAKTALRWRSMFSIPTATAGELSAAHLTRSLPLPAPVNRIRRAFEL